MEDSRGDTVGCSLIQHIVMEDSRVTVRLYLSDHSIIEISDSRSMIARYVKLLRSDIDRSLPGPRSVIATTLNLRQFMSEAHSEGEIQDYLSRVVEPVVDFRTVLSTQWEEFCDPSDVDEILKKIEDEGLNADRVRQVANDLVSMVEQVASMIEAVHKKVYDHVHQYLRAKSDVEFAEHENELLRRCVYMCMCEHVCGYVYMCMCACVCVCIYVYM